MGLKDSIQKLIGKSLFRFVFGKTCHLSLELEHKAFWVIQNLNFDTKAYGKRRMELNAMDEFRLDVYPNVKMYKECTNLSHDKHILTRNFELGH